MGLLARVHTDINKHNHLLVVNSFNLVNHECEPTLSGELGEILPCHIQHGHVCQYTNSYQNRATLNVSTLADVEGHPVRRWRFLIYFRDISFKNEGTK
jgi:hypothetical protein